MSDENDKWINEKLVLESELKAKSRKTSIIEGCFSASSGGFGDHFIVAFAQALQASPFQIGILNALPGLFSPIAQGYGSRLIEKKSRKEIVTKFVLIQSLLWIPLSLLALAFFSDFGKSYLPLILVLGYSLIALSGGLAGPAWFSWMGDIVDDNERGKYFSKRNRITGAFGTIGFLLGALLLDFVKTKGYVMIGFFILLFLAFVFRFVAFFFFKKQYEPELNLKDSDYYFSFWQFLKKRTNFVKFAIFIAALHFSMTIAGPFFTVYMLSELNFSYTTFMIVSLSATLFYLLVIPFAGKFSDRYGNKSLLWFSGIVFSILPLFWIYLKSPILLILFPQLLGGLASAAFAIGMTNFIYNTVTPARRAICIAYTNILVGVGVFSGSILGGTLVNYFDNYPFNSYFAVFLISSILRVSSVLVFLPFIKEIKSFETFRFPVFLMSEPFEFINEQFVWFRGFSKQALINTKKGFVNMMIEVMKE